MIQTQITETSSWSLYKLRPTL